MRTKLSPLLLCAAALAQQFTPLPLLPGDDTVAPSAGNQRRPALATGAGGLSLVVFEDDRSSLLDTVFGGQVFGSSVPGNFDVYAMFVDAGGQPIGPAPFVVCGETWDQRRPKVAWNGTAYLVVFEHTEPTMFYYSRGIYGVRVDGSGTVLDPVPIRIDDNDDVDELFPVVTAVGGDWVVAWADSAGGVNVIQAATVSAGGLVGANKPVLVTGAVVQSPTQHSLAAVGSQLLLAWSINNGSGVRAQRFTAAGVPQGSVLSLAANQGIWPAVASDGVGYYAAWFGGGQVVGTPIDTAGVIAVPNGAPLGLVGNDSVCAVGHDGGAWVVAIDASPSVRAARVGAGGTLLGSATVSTSPGSVDDVAVGIGAGSAVVVWTDRRMTTSQFGGDPDDVFAATVGGGGIGPTTAVSVSPPAQVGAVLAGDPSVGFLCVYRSLIAGETRFLAQRLAADGTPVGSQVLVHSGNRSLGTPDVAWNGSEFIVVWSQLMSLVANGPPPLVFARRVRLDGTLLDVAPVQVMEGGAAAVDAVGSTFLIVSRFHHVVLQSNAAMRYRRLDGSSGAFLDAGPVVILIGAAGPVDVVGLADRWFVAWGRGTAAFVTAAGVPSAPFYAADTGGSGAVTRLEGNAARDEAVLVYQYQTSSMPQADVRLRRFSLTGVSPDPLLGPLVSGQNQGQWRPTVVPLDDEYLVAWADHRDSLDYEPGLGDVFAARLSATAALLDPAGIAVLDTAAAEGGQFGIRSGRGEALLATSAIAAGGFGTHRLRLVRYANASVQPWSEVGSGLPGSAGQPRLRGYGPLQSNTSFDLTLQQAVPNGLGVLALGLSPLGAPLFGGVLVPTPEVTLLVGASASGTWTFAGTWPAGFSGTSLFGQVWLLDPLGPQGFAATAGVRGLAP